MLRGSSRHDGIPFKQSAQDRDRDRQREQQRKERAQMLPDDKEVHAGTQDLFHAPVKVKPSVEDTTSQQIRNSLGSFESIRHLMIDPDSSRRLTYLVGVDQGSLPGTPGAAHRISSHNSSGGVEPPQYRPSSVSVPLLGTTDSNSTKSHYTRNLFPVVNHHSVVSNNANNIHNPISSATSSSTTSNSGSGGNNSLPPSTNSFRVSSNPNHIPSNNQQQKVPHSQNQPQQQQHSSIFNTTVANNLSSVPNLLLNNSTGPILNTRSPNISNNNNQVRSKPNLSYGNSTATSVSVDVNLDGASGSSSDNKFSVVANNNEPNISNCNNNSVRNDKSSKASLPNKKPALERANSQLELESILKEMTDIAPPLTGIQTPAKENLVSKKLSLRRSSKSEEKIVQSIINSGMAKVPSPIEKMDSSADSSSSYETDSDSESEDSSSGSHPGGDKLDNANPPPAPVTTGSPTTKWNLSSFLKSTEQATGKDGKPFGEKDSFLEDLAPSAEKGDNVTSTVSGNNKSLSASPLDAIPPTNMGLATRASRTRAESSRSLESNIPPAKPLPPSIPNKGSSSLNSKISSLTASSSEDEEETKTTTTKAKKPVATTATTKPLFEDKKATTTGGTTATNPPTRNKRPRASGQSTSAAAATKNSTTTAAATNNKSDGESSPEAINKNNKNGQDKNKNLSIRKLFRLGTGTNKPGGKGQSPSMLDVDISGGKPNQAGSGSGVSTPAPSKQSTNRVSGKGGATVAHNGDVAVTGAAANLSDNKKKDGSKEKGSSQARKHPKAPANSHSKSLTPPENVSAVPCPPPVRIKDEGIIKSSSSPSSLMVRIPLEKLRRKPPIAPSTFLSSASIISPSAIKMEKELEKAGKLAPTTNIVTTPDPFRLKPSQNSSRVGSSSDPTTNPLFTSHELSVSHDRNDPMCSEKERLINNKSSNKKRPKKRSRSSPKKAKLQRDPLDSVHTKVEDDPAYGEVSSNVLGYAPCDSVSVSTTRTPPIDPDIVQAPDSSLNPPHLPSPFVPPQLTFYSYFEKIEPKDDLFSRDQDSYLEEAKKLKHSADQERTSTTQASMYLEAGLYFILTGILMERDFNMGISGIVSGAAYTMYRDTLTLIQYIGNRWRSSRQEANIVEAKIITLSMRCQALLSLKLFKLKLKETKEMAHNMNEYFTKAPQRDPLVISSPQLSTPSPHSPTSSPAGSSGVLHTPSPHHPQQHQQSHLVHTLPRALYTQIHKHCNHMYHAVIAHDIWEQADGYVTKYHLEDFFIGIDRQFGPLTLHSSLTDLVRYVRQGLQLINGS